MVLLVANVLEQLLHWIICQGNSRRRVIVVHRSSGSAMCGWR
jgi:hypothetical protein